MLTRTRACLRVRAHTHTRTHVYITHLDACEALELFWKENMCLYKGMAMQSKYLSFLSGCCKTDTPRFAKILSTLFGPKKSPGFKAACAALEDNVAGVKLQRKALKDCLASCSSDITAARTELNKWRKEWKKEAINPAPAMIYNPNKLEKSMIPFIINITCADVSDNERKQKVSKIVETISPFFKQKVLEKESTPDHALAKFVNLMIMFCEEALDLDPDEKEVIDAYYPNPLLELLDFEDCVSDDINGLFLDVSLSVLDAIKKIDELDMITFKLYDECSFEGDEGKPGDMREALKRVQKNAKKHEKRARMHFCETPEGDFELAALWVKDKSIVGQVKEYFGLSLAKQVPLPAHLQVVATRCEEVLGEQRTIRDTLEGLEQKIIIRQIEVKDDWLEVENIMGKSPLTMAMETDNYDKKTIKSAYKATNNNIKKVNSIVKKLTATKKREKNWKESETRTALKEYEKIDSKFSTIKEYLREHEAPDTKVCPRHHHHYTSTL